MQRRFSVSTAAQGKYQTGPGYEVARPQGKCGVCAAALPPEQKFMAALVELPAGFQRIDCCEGCWSGYQRKDVVAFWQASMPRPEQKKKLFVDDAVLCELFERLAEVEEPAKVNFRFVLGLILMRKRLLIYEGMRTDGGRELWSVRLRGRQEPLQMLDPKLGEQQVMEVSQQLGEILQQEF
jgi:hypothetical protein